MKDKTPNIVVILVLTVVTVVMWIALSVYWALTTKPEEKVPAEISQELTPTLDQAAMGKIQTRIFLDENSINENVIIPTPEAVPVPEATLTPEATLAPEASESAGF